MKLKKCGCKYCRFGMRTKGQSNLIRKIAKGARHKAHEQVAELQKELINNPYEIPETEVDKEVQIPYTD